MARYQHNKYYNPLYDNYNTDAFSDTIGSKKRKAPYGNRDGRFIWHGGRKDDDYDFYYLPEKIAEHPERLDELVKYFEDKGLFDLVDEQQFREVMTNYGATGSRMHFLKEMLEESGHSYEVNYYVQSLAHVVSQDETLVANKKEREATKIAEKEAKEEAFQKRLVEEDYKRLKTWKDQGYRIDIGDDGEYHAYKNGEDITIGCIDSTLAPEYAPGYQTAAATAANSDKVYIDGKEYNSISEASRETGLSRNTIANGLDDGKTHKGHIITSDGPTSQTYWATREFVNQRRADRNILTADEKVQAVLKDTYVKCAKELNAFYDKLQDGYVPTKSELLRMEEYQVMCANMIEHFDAAALSEAEIVKDCLIDTSGFVLSGYSKEQVEAFAFTEFNGINYSQRIWNNTEVLEEKVKAAVGEAIITGKSYKEAARDLAELTTQGRNATHRLIVTETARVYNKAEQQEYKDAGIQYVEILVEPGACEECEAFKGKVWRLGEQPELPAHCFCRCDMIPVIK